MTFCVLSCPRWCLQNCLRKPLGNKGFRAGLSKIAQAWTANDEHTRFVEIDPGPVVRPTEEGR